MSLNSKFGIREICDVVLKAKAAQKIGNKVFYKNEPVIYFDTLKTSSMEGAATTVYAQGGKGNPRHVAWEGERTVTVTMEDALISPTGFMILSGAGLIEASDSKTIKVHQTEQTDELIIGEDSVKVVLSEKPYITGKEHDDLIYVMAVVNDEITTEPYIPLAETQAMVRGVNGEWEAAESEDEAEGWAITLKASDDLTDELGNTVFKDGVVFVDYYTEKKAGAQQIEITADKFGGNYYLEASTLFRNTDGVDMPAEFIIPNCKIQSNFTFTMASSGDPSTFTFTMDAFPDYTRFDKTKKVLAAIQIIETAGTADVYREHTAATTDEDSWNAQKNYFE